MPASTNSRQPARSVNDKRVTAETKSATKEVLPRIPQPLVHKEATHIPSPPKTDKPLPKDAFSSSRSGDDEGPNEKRGPVAEKPSRKSASMAVKPRDPRQSVSAHGAGSRKDNPIDISSSQSSDSDSDEDMDEVALSNAKAMPIDTAANPSPNRTSVALSQRDDGHPRPVARQTSVLKGHSNDTAAPKAKNKDVEPEGHPPAGSLPLGRRYTGKPRAIAKVSTAPKLWSKGIRPAACYSDSDSELPSQIPDSQSSREDDLDEDLPFPAQAVASGGPLEDLIDTGGDDEPMVVLEPQEQDLAGGLEDNVDDEAGQVGDEDGSSDEDTSDDEDASNTKGQPRRLEYDESSGSDYEEQLALIEVDESSGSEYEEPKRNPTKVNRRRNGKGSNPQNTRSPVKNPLHGNKSKGKSDIDRAAEAGNGGVNDSESGLPGSGEDEVQSPQKADSPRSPKLIEPRRESWLDFKPCPWLYARISLAAFPDEGIDEAAFYKEVERQRESTGGKVTANDQEAGGLTPSETRNSRRSPAALTLLPSQSTDPHSMQAASASLDAPLANNFFERFFDDSELGDHIDRITPLIDRIREPAMTLALKQHEQTLRRNLAILVMSWLSAVGEGVSIERTFPQSDRWYMISLDDVLATVPANFQFLIRGQPMLPDLGENPSWYSLALMLAGAHMVVDRVDPNHNSGVYFHPILGGTLTLATDIDLAARKGDRFARAVQQHLEAARAGDRSEHELYKLESQNIDRLVFLWNYLGNHWTVCVVDNIRGIGRRRWEFYTSVLERKHPSRWLASLAEQALRIDELLCIYNQWRLDEAPEYLYLGCSKLQSNDSDCGPIALANIERLMDGAALPLTSRYHRLTLEQSTTLRASLMGEINNFLGLISNRAQEFSALIAKEVPEEALHDEREDEEDKVAAEQWPWDLLNTGDDLDFDPTLTITIARESGTNRHVHGLNEIFNAHQRMMLDLHDKIFPLASDALPFAMVPPRKVDKHGQLLDMALDSFDVDGDVQRMMDPTTPGRVGLSLQRSSANVFLAPFYRAPSGPQLRKRTQDEAYIVALLDALQRAKPGAKVLILQSNIDMTSTNDETFRHLVETWPELDFRLTILKMGDDFGAQTELRREYLSQYWTLRGHVTSPHNSSLVWGHFNVRALYLLTRQDVLRCSKQFYEFWKHRSLLEVLREVHLWKRSRWADAEVAGFDYDYAPMLGHRFHRIDSDELPEPQCELCESMRSTERWHRGQESDSFRCSDCMTEGLRSPDLRTTAWPEKALPAPLLEQDDGEDLSYWKQAIEGVHEAHRCQWDPEDGSDKLCHCYEHDDGLCWLHLVFWNEGQDAYDFEVNSKNTLVNARPNNWHEELKGAHKARREEVTTTAGQDRIPQQVGKKSRGKTSRSKMISEARRAVKEGTATRKQKRVSDKILRYSRNRSRKISEARRALKQGTATAEQVARVDKERKHQVTYCLKIAEAFRASEEGTTTATVEQVALVDAERRRSGRDRQSQATDAHKQKPNEEPEVQTEMTATAEKTDSVGTEERSGRRPRRKEVALKVARRARKEGTATAEQLDLIDAENKRVRDLKSSAAARDRAAREHEKAGTAADEQSRTVDEDEGGLQFVFYSPN